MAQSRLEKIGTIFSRTTGLLRSGAIKYEDRPLWYDVYAAFPPEVEPRFDRPIPNITLKKIYYEEDIIRAKYHKTFKAETVTLEDYSRKTNTQEFITIYNKLKSEGALDEQKIFEVAKSMLDDQIKSRRESSEASKLSMEEAYEQSTEAQQPKKTSVDIKSLFNEEKL